MRRRPLTAQVLKRALKWQSIIIPTAFGLACALVVLMMLFL